MSDEAEKLSAENAKQYAELANQDNIIEELLGKLDVLGRQLEKATYEVEGLEQEVQALNEQLQRREIVAYSKLTRRQQKMWPKWIAEVDLSNGMKLKPTFAFPKIGLQAMDRGKWVRLTGTAQPEGLTKDEGADICEYLNSFPENQTHLRNMDAEFRSTEDEERLRAGLKK